LDTYQADVVCCATHPFTVMDGWWVRIKNVSVERGAMVQLSSTNQTTDQTLENIGTIVVCPRENYSDAHNTGLFVWYPVKFI